MSSKTAAPSTDENAANAAFEETQEQEYQQILTTLCEMVIDFYCCFYCCFYCLFFFKNLI